MPKLKLIYLFLFLFSMHFNAFCQFTPKQQADVQKKARKVISEYESRINTLGKEVKSIDRTRLNIEAFLKLFISRKTHLYNDLDPAYQLSEYYEAESYASNLALWYPGGINIKIIFDDARVSNIISHGDGVYSIDFITDKKIDGMYLGKTLNNNVEKLRFKIGFTISGTEYKNFKIAGIRNSLAKEEPKESKEIMEIKSADLTPDEVRDIDRETKTVLGDYANYLSLIGDTVEDIEEKIAYKKSFKELFTQNQALVFNDILPESRTQFVPVTDYINLYSEAYASDGGTVTFQLDSADLGYIMKRNDSVFYRSTQVDKSFTGNYLGKRKVGIRNRLSLKIVFEYKNGLYKNFKIDRIDRVIAKKSESSEITFTNLEKQIEKDKPKTNSAKKGKPDENKIMISIGYTPNYCKIIDGNINELTKAKNGYTITTTPSVGYSLFGQYIYMITPKFGMLTGIGYTAISTKFSVIDSFIDNYAYKDINNKDYLKYFSLDFDSTVDLKYINIPVGLYFNLKMTKKISLFIKPVINFSFLSKANVTYHGTQSYYMVYNSDYDSIKEIPWPDELLTRKDWKLFGAYNYNVPGSKTKTDTLNYLHLIADISAGISFSINKRFSLAISGNLQYGLNDLKKKENSYLDIVAETEYGNSLYGKSAYNQKHINAEHVVSPAKAARIITYGITAELIIKL